MSKTKILEIYPEQYLVEEDEMSDNSAQFQLMVYLVQVLAYYYRLENWFVIGDMMLLHPSIRNSTRQITPDVLVFKGIEIGQEERKYMSSWSISDNRPAPPVVFEVSSEKTWKNDIRLGEWQKPRLYGQIGVSEYFAYDPFKERVWQGEEHRLLGWRYDEQGQPIALIPDKRGWLWSDELESWLGSDGENLRLYNRDGQQRLTGFEAEAQARLVAEEQTKAEIQAKLAETQARQLAEEQVRKANEARRAIEARLAEVEELLRRQMGEN